MRSLLLATGLLSTLVLGLGLGLPGSAMAANDALCGPFVSTGVSAATPMAGAAQGVFLAADAASQGVSAAPGRDGDLGSIVKLPSPSPADAAEGKANRPSEAILALPKNPAGKIPDNFELGPGASIAASFFSPVICATVARVKGPPGTALNELVTFVPEGSALVANDVYASASEAVRPVAPADVAPEPDPYAVLQYGLAVSGIREAREITTGEGVTIALLDSAPEEGHRDLSSARILSLTTGEEEPEVGVHGTLMAGVINAIEGNGFGIAGVAPGARLVSIPICKPAGSAGGQCTIYDLLRGLDQAWDAEAHVVNLSLSGPPNVLLERGVARLEALGAVVVAAAGNEGTSDERYPAAYPSVVGVGAIDREGRPFSGSNRGDWVEIVAPGVDVLSTVPGNAFAFGNGTSLAAAHVSGTLALLTSVTKNPKLARGELFRTLAESKLASQRVVPKVCDVLGRIDVACTRAENVPASSKR